MLKESHSESPKAQQGIIFRMRYIILVTEILIQLFVNAHRWTNSFICKGKILCMVVQ